MINILPIFKATAVKCFIHCCKWKAGVLYKQQHTKQFTKWTRWFETAK